MTDERNGYTDLVSSQENIGTLVGEQLSILKPAQQGN